MYQKPGFVKVNIDIMDNYAAYATTAATTAATNATSFTPCTGPSIDQNTTYYDSQGNPTTVLIRRWYFVDGQSSTLDELIYGYNLGASAAGLPLHSYDECVDAINR